MKQHINKEQWAELSEAQQGQLRSWWIQSDSRSGTIMSKGAHYRDLVFSGGGHAPAGQENELLVIGRGECCFQQNLRDDEHWEGDWVPWSKCHPLLNIGQMIEFLGDDWVNYFPLGWQERDYMPDPSENHLPDNDYLCDQLWEAVKAKLK